MMRIPFVFCFFIAVASAQFGGFGNLANRFQNGINTISSALKTVPVLSNVKDFGDFAAQSGKNYASAAESTLREGIFNTRKSLVDANNAAFSSGLATYELGVNAFADLTQLEFLNKLTGNKKNSKGDSKAKQHRQAAKPVAGALIPDSFDWRTKGGVTPVKFQDECGSCWSFAATGAIEGHLFRKTGKLSVLSEQNLIDCGNEDFGLNGCDGGFQEYAFEFINNQKGISESGKYPYANAKKSCTYNNSLRGATITGHGVIEPNDETTMKKVIATLGPLACSVNGLESLLLYKRGIYSDEECNKGEPNHSVLVVGYGTENGIDFWIVKNSWDKSWGEDGYFRLPRGKNFCGIASECSYPIV